MAISNSTASRHGTRRGAGGVGPGLASSLWRWHCHHCGGGLQHTVKGVRVLSVSLIWSQTRWPSALCLPFDPFPVPVGRARAGRSQFSVALSLRAGALCGGGRPGSSPQWTKTSFLFAGCFHQGETRRLWSGTTSSLETWGLSRPLERGLRCPSGIRGEIPVAKKLRKKSKYFTPTFLANRPSGLNVAWSPLLPLVHL